jgi:dihydroorotate dehydrogenase electron transfer subunit
VIANEAICREHYLLRLSLAAFPPSRAGQFVQLQCRPVREQISAAAVEWGAGRPPVFTQPELTDHEPMLRRPFSLSGRSRGDGGRNDNARDVLEIIYRTIGTGTRWLSEIAPGVALSVLGPLGNGFAPVPDAKVAVLVAGGVGIPPMIYLARELAAAGKRVFAFCGAKSADLVPVRIDDRAGVSTDGEPSGTSAAFPPEARIAVATDDGSLGFAGTVGDAFRRWLERNVRYAHALAVYSCGPEPMMKAVADACVPRKIPCQLALERHMACGMGTCQSCVVKIRDASERGWSFKLCCTDGPVFDARDVIWH